MKKCPTCDKTYEDSMRFCQIDGTSLVDDAPSFDPYATIVGKVVPPPAETQQPAPEPESNSSSRTVGSIPISEPDDVLDLPSNDPLKTMYVSEAEMREALGKQDQSDIIEIPAIESEPTPPSFIANDRDANTSSSGSSPFSSVEKEPPPIVSSAPPEPASPLTQEQPSSDEPPPVTSSAPPPSPFGSSSESRPVTSPFTDREYNSAEAPITAPPRFQDPEPARFDEAATIMQSGFDSSYDQPQQPAEWTPPAAPHQEWQNQPLGQETPFQPPLAGAADGANKTLAVVSLVLGILSFFCLGLFASVPAIILGFMQRSKIKQNPSEYGGSGFAMAGIVLGAINVVLTIVVLIFYGALIMANL